MPIFFRADLNAADLSNADLGGANLRAANLANADLRAANLADADLTDKGYHSRSVLKALDGGPWKTRISEPMQKGFARWRSGQARGAGPSIVRDRRSHGARKPLRRRKSARA